MKTYPFAHGRLVLDRGDITHHTVDAIVNAANPSLLGGGGVDGAIHAGGGPDILAGCRDARRRLGGDLPRGDAVVTTAGRLPARHVIHTAGPIHPEDADPDATLARCYRSCLALAVAHGLRTVAFPSISTGAYLFPIREASRIALATVSAALTAPSLLERVTFVLFSAADFDVYQAAARDLDFPEPTDG